MTSIDIRIMTSIESRESAHHTVCVLPLLIAGCLARAAVTITLMHVNVLVCGELAAASETTACSAPFCCYLCL